MTTNFKRARSPAGENVIGTVTLHPLLHWAQLTAGIFVILVAYWEPARSTVGCVIFPLEKHPKLRSGFFSTCLERGRGKSRFFNPPLEQQKKTSEKTTPPRHLYHFHWPQRYTNPAGGYFTMRKRKREGLRLRTQTSGSCTMQVWRVIRRDGATPDDFKFRAFFNWENRIEFIIFIPYSSLSRML